MNNGPQNEDCVISTNKDDSIILPLNTYILAKAATGCRVISPIEMIE